jgi:hypothetical protein
MNIIIGFLAVFVLFYVWFFGCKIIIQIISSKQK